MYTSKSGSSSDLCFIIFNELKHKKMSTNEFGKNGWTPERIGSLKGKTYVITGTTSGTGFEAARILLAKEA